MLGDDVVDLRDPEAAPGGTHPRFDERVFCPAEQALLRSGDSPVALRWTLWAAKESAFKAARRTDPKTVFSPVRFVVRLTDGSCATVTHDGRRFRVRILRRDDAVHAVAVAEPGAAADLVVDSARLVAEDPSAAVRRFAVERLAACLVIDAARLTLGGRKIPLLLVDGHPSPVEVSLCHHGEAIGFAALLPPDGSHRPAAAASRPRTSLTTMARWTT